MQPAARLEHYDRSGSISPLLKVFEQCGKEVAGQVCAEIIENILASEGDLCRDSGLMYDTSGFMSPVTKDGLSPRAQPCAALSPAPAQNY